MVGTPAGAPEATQGAERWRGESLGFCCMVSPATSCCQETEQEGSVGSHEVMCRGGVRGQGRGPGVLGSALPPCPCAEGLCMPQVPPWTQGVLPEGGLGEMERAWLSLGSGVTDGVPGRGKSFQPGWLQTAVCAAHGRWHFRSLVHAGARPSVTLAPLPPA